MRPRSIILLIVTVLIVGFAALNWQNMLTTAPIHLLVTQVEAPLGLLFLLVVSAMLLLFFSFIAILEAQARSERKRLSDDIERWRKLADEAEASRIEQLRQIIEAGFDDLYDRMQRLGGRHPGGRHPGDPHPGDPLAEKTHGTTDPGPAADPVFETEPTEEEKEDPPPPLPLSGIPASES